MQKRLRWSLKAAVLIGLAGIAVLPAMAAPAVPEPLVYTVKSAAPETQFAEVEVTVPTGGKPTVEMRMAIWSPGFYKVENYATRVQDLAARTPDGKPLAVEQPQKNCWRIPTGGAPKVVVSYRVKCAERSVTTNWIDDNLAILNGAATFITLAESTPRPHEIHLELPTKWKRVMTGLDAAPDGRPNHFRAPDYDTLVDSPIAAGDLDVQEFTVDGRKHFLVAIGDRAAWNGPRAAGDVAKIVHQAHELWGFLPYEKYVFLIVFRPGGGGLEHKNSTLVTSNAAAVQTPRGYHTWLSLVSHEYFHLYNVKRLRPVELGPFDYEREPHTKSLWISEGFTSYYGDLQLRHAGLSTQEEYLTALSRPIDQLQKSPGRLRQSLEQSSDEVWNNSTSGINASASTVSYYIKGEVVGFLLDAKIRAATGGKKSLDDMMRLAYKRYAGEHGFTPEEFRKTASEVAGTDLEAWFQSAVSSAQELDYTEALDWFGLRFAPTAETETTKTWKLEPRPDASDAQKSHLLAWLK